MFFVMILPITVNSYIFLRLGREIVGFNYMLSGAISLSIITTILFLIYYTLKRNYIAIFYGCHQKTSRTFHYRNHYFVLCARCTGIQLGIFLSLVLALVDANHLFYLLLAIPMLIDGILQHKTKYVSNNLKRVITGILFGPSLVILFGGFYYFMLYLSNELVKLI